MSSSSARALADAIAGEAVRRGQTTPAVRGADWQTATVTAVGTGTVDCGDIRARRLESYLGPAVGDLIVISRSGQGNWLAHGRTATAADTSWTSYPAAWTSSGTAPNLGNGVLIGRYQKLGRTVDMTINLTVGTTTTGGTGNSFLSLPIQAANAGCTYIGHAQFAGNARWAGQFVIAPAGTTGTPFFPAGAADVRLTQMSPNTNAPEAVGSGDVLRITATYESAT